MPIRDLDHDSRALIRSLWGYAAGMMAIVGIFGGGSDRKLWAMMVPPAAAAATTIYLIRQEEQKHHELQDQAEHLRVVETRLQTLETIVTKEDLIREVHPLPQHIPPQHTAEP